MLICTEAWSLEVIKRSEVVQINGGAMGKQIKTNLSLRICEERIDRQEHPMKQSITAR